MLWNQLNYVIQKVFYISFYIEIKKRRIPCHCWGDAAIRNEITQWKQPRSSDRTSVSTFSAHHARCLIHSIPNLLRYLYHTIHIFIKGILWVFSYNLIDDILKSNGIQPDCVKKSKYLFYKTSIYITIQCK